MATWNNIFSVKPLCSVTLYSYIPPAEPEHTVTHVIVIVITSEGTRKLEKVMYLYVQGMICA